MPASDASANSERFVAFTFAGADIAIETDPEGTVTYAAGALRSRFGRPPESFVGHPVRELVAPADHDALDAALAMLAARGRLLPFMIRLADPERTALSLGGITIPSRARPPRLCLSLARPPAPAQTVLRAGSPHGLARAAEARLRAGTPCDLGLLEVTGTGGDPGAGEAIGAALERAAPDVVASEIAPGRYGLLGAGNSIQELQAAARMVEAALRGQGLDAAATASHMALDAEGLTPVQTARALRQALNVFARDGAVGLAKDGFSDGLSGYMRRAASQADGLRRAIRSGHFELLYQPIVSLSQGTPHHYEALIRPRPLKDAEFSGPQDFVMLIEALGLADELDLAVARRACDAADAASASVAFNLSGQSVQNPAFRDQLTGLLAASPARDRGLILVEMTETAEIEDAAETARTADALRDLGVPFCLDDFGAGAADLRLLRQLSADIVKLDGSYIPGVTEPGRERAFIAGMVEIARAAGAEVVAERVETATEAAALRDLGVQYGQGWHFGKPAPLPPALSSATPNPLAAAAAAIYQEALGPSGKQPPRL